MDKLNKYPVFVLLLVFLASCSNVPLAKNTGIKQGGDIVSQAVNKKPQIILETVIFDFGQVEKKLGTIRKVIKIDNRGGADLVISKLKTSCSCVRVALSIDNRISPYFSVDGSWASWQSVIPANKTARLEIALDLIHPSITTGKVVREIFIDSNDPVNPKVAIMIQAFVK